MRWSLESHGTDYTSSSATLVEATVRRDHKHAIEQSTPPSRKSKGPHRTHQKTLRTLVVTPHPQRPGDMMASMDAVIQRTPPVVARTHWETAPQLTRLRARNTSVLFRIGIDSRTIAELESRYGRHFTYAVDAVHEHGGFTWFLAETHGDGFAIWLEGEPMHRVEGIEGMMEDVKGCRRYNFDVDISLSFDERAARGHLGLIVTAKQVCQGLWDRWPRVEMSAGFFKPPVDDVDPPTEAATKRTRLGSRRRGSTKKDKREPQKAAGQTKGRQLPQEKQEDGQTRPYDSEKRPCESGKRPCDDEKSEKRPKTGKQEST